MYVPIHSDFIIHWTGIDIDNDKNWEKSNSSKTNKEETDLYLNRLKSILKYGLWMNKEKGDEFIDVDFPPHKIKRPLVSRTCFTELQLSKVRSHAKKFGRLGIGFKRFFLFDRNGGPMNYYCSESKNWIFYPALQNNNKYGDDAYYSCFLKPMYKKSTDKETRKYSYYDESEWRIIYSEEIGKAFENLTHFFKTPKEWSEDFNKYLKEHCKNQPDYLIPLNTDGKTISRWFAMIIYPSLSAKVEAERDQEIRRLIQTLKPEIKTPTNGEKTENAYYESYSKPLEVDLDACRNF